MHFESEREGDPERYWDEVMVTGYRIAFSCNQSVVIPFVLKIESRLDASTCPGCGAPAVSVSTIFRKKTDMAQARVA